MKNELKKAMYLIMTVFICTLLIPGCGGGGGGGSTGGGSAAGGTGNVVMEFPFPDTAGKGAVTIMQAGEAKEILLRIIPANVQYYIVHIYESGTTLDAVEPVRVDRPATGNTVTVTIYNVPPGPKTVFIQAYDINDVLLAEGTQDVTVLAGFANNVDVSLNPIGPTPTPTATPTATPTPTPTPPAVWVTEIADGTVGMGRYCSLAMGASDVPMISYYDEVNTFLRFTERIGGVWTPIVVDNIGNCGTDTSIALDSLGNPAISYYHSNVPPALGNLKYASRIGGVWTNAEINNTSTAVASFVNKGTSLAFGSSGEPSISFFLEAGNTGLYFAEFLAGIWSVSTPDGVPTPPPTKGINSSLAYRGSLPSISYAVDQGATTELWYSNFNGVSWNPVVVDGSATLVGEFSSLAFNASGNPGISYYDRTNGHLKFAFNNGLGWALETVDPAVGVGQYTSLVFDSSGSPMISYYDVTNGDLKFARKDLTTGLWTMEVVDFTGNVGMYSSLELNSLGQPCISYFDAGTRILKFATKQ